MSRRMGDIHVLDSGMLTEAFVLHRNRRIELRWMTFRSRRVWTMYWIWTLCNTARGANVDVRLGTLLTNYLAV
jgi:hypothetical protein